MKCKDITIGDIINVLPFNRTIAIYDRRKVIVHIGIANKIPDKFYDCVVSLMDIQAGDLRIEIEEIIK